MLKTLSVWNFALIENANVEFDEGLNILTGETGAGKSILIDALGIILGSRANVGNIRTGCEQLRVEAVFLLNPNDKVREILSELEIEIEDDTLIINRKIAKTGKSSIIVNGSHVTLATLKRIGSALIDVHGQNENLALLKESNTYNLIDGDSKDMAVIINDYHKLYRSWSSQKKVLEDKKKSSADNEQRLDILRWQEKEISEANLKSGEDEELEMEIRRLSNSEKIAEHVKESCSLLNGDNEFNVLTSLAKVGKNLDEISRYDNSLDNARKMLEDAAIMLNEAFADIYNYSEQMEFSPERLDNLQERMDIIHRLKKKYGATIDNVIKYYEKINRELVTIENYDSDVEILEQRIAKLEAQTRKRAYALTKARQKSAAMLSAKVEKELKQLGMPKAKFSLMVTPIETLTNRGSDEVDMLFNANAGEEPQPLSKVASGGELSRIALAIKTIDANRENSAATMVFDEIDTGLGGVTANAVAECIAKVAVYRQVLCITHLPQIACMADVHIFIDKKVDENRTVTKVSKLSEVDHVKEIARMASGVDATLASMENAREMVMSANKKKSILKRK